MSDIATWEPSRITAGDRWLWERQDLTADYPASSWTLSYSLAKAGAALISITASANGDYHRVDVSASTTADYPVGTYHWQAHVTSGSDRRTVGEGRIEIRPNLAAQPSGYDGRSQARRTLEAINAVLEGRASKDQQAYAIAGRSLNRTPIPELLMLRDRFAAIVQNEDAAESIRRGLGNPRKFFVRYGRA